MARRYSLIISILLLARFGPTLVNASGFHALRQPIHARTLAMNGAFTGEEGAATSLFWNPAGLQSLDALEASVSYEQHLVDVSATEIVGGYPIGRGAFGLGLTHWNYGEFDQRDAQGEIIGAPVSAAENRISAGYGVHILPDIAIGLSLDLFSRNFADTRESYVFYSVSLQRAYSELDLTVGLTLSHWGTAFAKTDDYTAFAPKKISGGMAKKLAHLPLELYIDAVYSPRDDNLRGKVGGEFTITENENLFLRFGLTSDRFDQQTQVVSGDFFAGSGFGFGIRRDAFEADYGFQTFGGAGIVQAVTLTFQR